jgi:hypothetical protein
MNGFPDYTRGYAVKAGWNEMLVGDVGGVGSVGEPDFSGERALMVAVLLDALSIFYKTEAVRDHRKRLEFHEVYTWIYGKYADNPFSFDNICGAIGIDADALRESLRRGGRVAKQRERHFKHMVGASSRAKAA